MTINKAYVAIPLLLLSGTALADTPLPVPAGHEPIGTGEGSDAMYLQTASLRHNTSFYGRDANGTVMRFAADETGRPVYTLTAYIAYCEEDRIVVLETATFDAAGIMLTQSDKRQRYDELSKGAAPAEQAIYTRLCSQWDEYD